MVAQYGNQRGLVGDDCGDLPIRVRRRSPLQELRDYPFLLSEEEQPTPAPPSWALRHGGACLTALGIVGAIEVVLLGLLLR
jgi:hypothetical protein